MTWQLVVETMAGPLLFGMFPDWLNCEFVRSLLPAPGECVPRPIGGEAQS